MLELAIAAGLAGIVLMGTAVLAMRASSAWRAADSRLQQQVRLEKGLQRLAEDFRHGVPVSGLPFRGARDEVRFARATGLTELTDVRYRLEPEAAGCFQLVRESAPYPNPDGLAPQAAKVIPSLTSFQLLYGVRAEEEGSNAVRWSEKLGDESQESAIPKVIRVTLQSVDARGRAVGASRDLWVPHGQWQAAPGE